ncbi:sigma-70 family RNA polymerase sigma factor [Maribacter sp.]|nr:sigma-70 family RNA polymerase sigma factor [Maribacter sp.]
MNKKRYSDKQVLLGDLRQGIRMAHTHVFDCYADELNSYMAVICGNRTMAQDIVQETFVKFWDKRKKIAVKDNIKRYLFRMAFNLYKDYQKQNAKKLALIRELQNSAVHQVIENDHDDTEKRLALLNREIDLLPKKCKMVFILRKKSGLSYNEIASKMNISVKTVEGHISKAMSHLKSVLK